MVITLKKTHFWYDNYQIFHMVHKLITISNSLRHEFKLEDAYQEVAIVGICCYFQWIEGCLLKQCNESRVLKEAKSYKITMFNRWYKFHKN
jgi:hypothetical protein